MVIILTKKRIIKALEGLGLTKNEIKVYIYLEKSGPHEEKEISEILELQDHQVYRSLKKLESIEIIKVCYEQSVKFSAIPFGEVIDLFIDVKKEQAKTMQESREDLLYSWREMMKKEKIIS